MKKTTNKGEKESKRIERKLKIPFGEIFVHQGHKFKRITDGYLAILDADNKEIGFTFFPLLSYKEDDGDYIKYDKALDE